MLALNSITKLLSHQPNSLERIVRRSVGSSCGQVLKTRLFSGREALVHYGCFTYRTYSRISRKIYDKILT